ncbi:MAG: hypothetical protein EXX96DRAFT_539275 [Benjaminiella poitrasii]|nr:MAG: hypothetical protein EXX96DRAFT_539275 [Benjaminiella poitrasii]
MILQQVMAKRLTWKGDLPGKRLNALKSVLRKLLLDKKRTHSLTKDDFEREMKDIKEPKLKVCLKISSRLLPYIPSADTFNFVVYQLPFVHLANDLLKISGYSGKTRPICPTISVSTLQSLRLDSAMIFNVFCSVCMENGLKFAHKVYILPGAKTVRILGNLQKTTSAERCTINSRAKNKNEGEHEASARVQIEEKNPKAILQDEINLLKTEISALESQLKKAYKDKNNQRFHIELKAQKQKWLWPNEDLQEKLSFARQSKHFKLMARNTRRLPQIKKDTQTSHDEGKKKITDDIPNLLDKVENIKLQSALEDFIFSGTDNGIKTMTETVALSLQRYNYHLDLYRLYNSDNSSGERKEDKFQALPRSMKIYSKDVDIGTGEAYMRRWRNQRKKNSKNGQECCIHEEKLANLSFKTADTIDDVFFLHKQHIQYTEKLRNYYYFNAYINKRRTSEIASRRFKDRLASRERNFIIQESTKNNSRRLKSLLFIGNRGTGVGSSIRSGLRYGGNWKMKNHARYAPVVCVYCFKKIIHPKRIRIIQGVERSVDCNGSSICINRECTSFKANRSVQSRDQQTAVAICISELYTLLSGTTLPVFSSKISHSNTDLIKTAPPPSGTGSEGWASSHRT